MKLLGRLLAALTLSLVAVSCITPDFRGPRASIVSTRNPQDVFGASLREALAESVFKVSAYAGSEPYSDGSLVVVDHTDADKPSIAATWCLTAGHLAAEGVTDFVVIVRGQIFRGKLAKLGESDWAELVFSGKFGVPFKRQARVGLVPAGTPVLHIGYPTNGDKFSEGQVINAPDPDYGGLLCHSAKTGPGSSGGAVIGLLGGKPVLIGIHVWRIGPMDGPTLYRVATPIYLILEEGGIF